MVEESIRAGETLRSCSPCHERLFFFILQTGSQERLSGQEPVSAPHTQAQVRHAEVQRLPRLHRKVCFKKKKKHEQIRILKPMEPRSSFLPRWYTTGDRFAPSNPCLFCDKCFRMLHYDTEGNKLGEFQAFPYVDRGAFN